MKRLADGYSDKTVKLSHLGNLWGKLKSTKVKFSEKGTSSVKKQESCRQLNFSKTTLLTRRK
jgi:hypothetical protein